MLKIKPVTPPSGNLAHLISQEGDALLSSNLRDVLTSSFGLVSGLGEGVAVMPFGLEAHALSNGIFLRFLVGILYLETGREKESSRWFSMVLGDKHRMSDQEKHESRLIFHELGNKYWLRGHVHKALYFFKAAVRLGGGPIRESDFWCGRCYERLGNFAKAHEMYTKAARRNNPDAQYRVFLTYRYTNPKDHLSDLVYQGELKQRTKWLAQAAFTGHAPAMRDYLKMLLIQTPALKYGNQDFDYKKELSRSVLFSLRNDIEIESVMDEVDYYREVVVDMMTEHFKTHAGYIYILRNPSHTDGHIKIGKSKLGATARAKQLNTGSAENFSVIGEWFFFDMDHSERALHQKLKKYHAKKEFFSMVDLDALRTVHAEWEDDRACLARILPSDFFDATFR